MSSQQIAQLQQQISSLSASLRVFVRRHNISRVALHQTNSEQFLICLLALANAGCDLVLPANGQVENLLEAAQHSDAIWFDTALQNVAQIDLAQQIFEHNKTQDEFSFPSTGTLTLFTSGSSGKAKAITKCWEHINTELANLNATFALTGNTKFVATVSHQHIYGMLFKLLWPYKYGHEIDFEFIEFPEQLAQKVANDKCVIVTSPAFLSRLVQDNVLCQHQYNVNAIFSSGGPLSDDDAVSLYQQLNVAAWQVYGSTETGGIGFRQLHQHEVTPWQLFKGVSLTKQGEQLCVRSPYFAEHQQLIDDTGEILSDGRFILKGRLDRTVKLAEKRINLDAIERSLLDHDAIRAAKVIVLKTHHREQLALVACLTESGQALLDKSSKFEFNKMLKAHLSTRFEAVCLPRKFRYLDEMPCNPQGKLAYVELEKLFD